MPTLEYLDRSYDCATAIKGEDYIRLLDDNGCLVASFDGIADFSAFELSGGEYTEPTPAHDCYLAVIRDDGTFARGGHRCSDITDKAPAYDCGVDDLTAGTSELATGRLYFVYE